MTAVVELCNALLTNLTHTLTGKPHLGTDLLKTSLLATDSETFTHDLQFAVLQSSPKGASILM